MASSLVAALCATSRVLIRRLWCPSASSCATVVSGVRLGCSAVSARPESLGGRMSVRVGRAGGLAEARPWVRVVGWYRPGVGRGHPGGSRAAAGSLAMTVSSRSARA